MKERTYIAIDLKSFYASVECFERRLDPLTTNLVVADASKTEKTICLAVSPALKSFGIPGRARLFEVNQKVKEVNHQRLRQCPQRRFQGKSWNIEELKEHKDLALDYIAAPPRMALYIRYSAKIYEIYLKYVSSEDIHVYSIDEVFIDVTHYLKTYRISAYDMAMMLIQEVIVATGITATAGIGTNLYLCKVAMDIVAKHIAPDENGVRIAQLDEMSYRKLLWSHRPFTDFWRVGKGIAKKLEAHGMYTMGDVARCSLENEDLLYRLFGVNAELLIDHAWGWEPCTMKDIKNYHSDNHSVGSGQVLTKPYTYEQGKLIVKEMSEALSLDLVDKKLVSDQLVLSVGYDIENMKNDKIRELYEGEIKKDFYGRLLPKPAHGSIRLPHRTSSSKEIMQAAVSLYERIADSALLVRRINIAACNVIDERVPCEPVLDQLDLFCDIQAMEEKERQEKAALEKEKKVQKAILNIKKKYGKNKIVKGMNLLENATAMERNRQIGGHKAGEEL